MTTSMEPSSEEGEQASRLSRFVLKWSLVAWLAALLLGIIIESAVLAGATVNHTTGWLNAVMGMAYVFAVVVLATLVRTRLFIAAGMLCVVYQLLVFTQALLDNAWSNITLHDPIRVSSVGIQIVAAFALAVLVRGPLALALAVAQTILIVTEYEVPWVSPIADLLLVVLIGLAFVRPPRLAPTPARTYMPTSVAGLSGLWIGPLVMLVLEWVGTRSQIIMTMPELLRVNGLFVGDLIGLYLLVRGARALRAASVPASVLAPLVGAVVVHGLATLFTTAGTVVRFSVSAPREEANLLHVHDVADPFFMAAAIAACLAVSLAARWAGDARERARATLAARLGMVTFIIYLPPLSWVTTWQERELSLMVLDALWLAGIIVLANAISGLRSTLARRALVDAL